MDELLPRAKEYNKVVVATFFFKKIFNHIIIMAKFRNNVAIVLASMLFGAIRYL